jgi:hypothetical protein
MKLHLEEDMKKKEPKKNIKRSKRNPGQLGTSVLPQTPDNELMRADHPAVLGSAILTGCRLFELTEQQRSKDPVHTHLVTNMYRGNSISFEFLKLNGYRILSSRDAQDPSWACAPILVSTNRQRYTLTAQRAGQFAASHGVPVIRWLADTKRWRNEPAPQHIGAAMQDPCFYEYFVPGCDGFFTDNYMADLHLINGMPVRYHSLSFDDGENQLGIVEEYVRRAAPGEVITLPFIPLAVNVEVLLPSSTPVEVREALLDFSKEAAAGDSNNGADSHIIVPIFPRCNKWTNGEVPVYGGVGFGPSHVHIRSRFPLEPGFAITVHKSEGRTMDRVIIALSSSGARGCTFSHQKLHVALSRVRMSAHIRLLLTGDCESAQWSSVTYLSGLKADPSISFFFGGFRDVTGPNPNKDWTTNRWCPKRANQVHREKLRSGLL